MSSSCPCKWSDFLGWIVPYVSSAKDEFKRPPNAMIEAFVRKAAYDFAVRSGSLRKKVYVDIACGVVDYPLPCTEAEDIISYKSVTYNGMELDRELYEVRDDILYLENKPSCDIEEGLCIEYSYAPCLEGACEVPEDFCTRYRQVIIDGALASLLSMPNMDWFSAQGADNFSQSYLAGISSAKVDIRKRKSSRKKTIYDMRTRFIR